MKSHIARLIATIAVLAVGIVGLQSPSQAAPSATATGTASAPPSESGLPTTIIQGVKVPSLGAPLVSDADGSNILEEGVAVTVEGADGQNTTITRIGAKPSAVEDRPGQTVFTETSADVDTVAESSADSARMLEIIKSEAGSQTFNYQVDVPAGTQMYPQSDGSIQIGTKQTVGEQVTIDAHSVIGAPWAVDAVGHPVDASYSINASGMLRMNVRPSASSVYPIVADPTVTAGGFRASWSIFRPDLVSIYLNKARTADAEDLGATICIGIAFVPAIGPVLAAICGVHNTIIRGTSRRGYCQKWVINAVTRSFRVELYRGGFCS